MAVPGDRIDRETRRLLAKLARSERTRDDTWTRKRPTEWRPTTVRDPRGGFFPTFTRHSAWDFVAEKLEEGHPVEIVPLDEPPARVGYVLKVELEGDPQTLYVKLELSRNRRLVHGRSFHY